MLDADPSAFIPAGSWPLRARTSDLTRRGSDFGVLWDSTCRAMLQSDHYTH